MLKFTLESKAAVLPLNFSQCLLVATPVAGVVPLSPRLGLLEFVSGTTTLEGALVPGAVPQAAYDHMRAAYQQYAAVDLLFKFT